MQINAGKNTPGVDMLVVKTPARAAALATAAAKSAAFSVGGSPAMSSW
jgi:hypothetical protein